MKKVSSEWIKQTDFEIIDPDGWDRTNFNYSFNEELITFDEFIHRLFQSTVLTKNNNE